MRTNISFSRYASDNFHYRKLDELLKEELKSLPLFKKFRLVGLYFGKVDEQFGSYYKTLKKAQQKVEAKTITECTNGRYLIFKAGPMTIIYTIIVFEKIWSIL